MYSCKSVTLWNQEWNYHSLNLCSMNMNSGLILTSGESVEYDINHVGYMRTKGVNETWFSPTEKTYTFQLCSNSIHWVCFKNNKVLSQDKTEMDVNLLHEALGFDFSLLIWWVLYFLWITTTGFRCNKRTVFISMCLFFSRFLW